MYSDILVHILHGVSYCSEFPRDLGKTGCLAGCLVSVPTPEGETAQPSQEKAWGRQLAHREPAWKTFTHFHLKIYSTATIYLADEIFHILSTRENGKKNRGKGAGKR